MKGNFEQCLALTLKHEGGWVNDPHDPGGETNMGVTKRTYEDWVGHEVAPGSLKTLTVADVEPIYRKKYWDACKCDQLPAGVDFVVFDFAVNSGVTWAIRYLQNCSGSESDGLIGPKTLAAVQSKNPVDLCECVCDNRLAFLKKQPTWPRYSKGWSRRVASVRKASLSMVGQA
jgi:lysozyme family protein